MALMSELNNVDPTVTRTYDLEATQIGRGTCLGLEFGCTQRDMRRSSERNGARTFSNGGAAVRVIGGLKGIEGYSSSVYDVSFGGLEEGGPLNAVAINDAFAEFAGEAFV